MDESMEKVLSDCVGMLRGVLRVFDPDTIADVVTFYWYQIAHGHQQPSLQLVRWSLAFVRSGKPFPGSSRASRHGDVFRRRTRVNLIEIVHRRCFLNPAYAAEVNDEISLVARMARTGSQRAAMRGLLLSQTDHEAALASGYTEDTISDARQRLRKRCRAVRCTTP